MSGDPALGRGIERPGPELVRAGDALEEMPSEEHGIALAGPERRQIEQDDGEPVEEIGAKPSRSDEATEIVLGRGDQLDVDRSLDHGA